MRCGCCHRPIRSDLLWFWRGICPNGAKVYGSGSAASTLSDTVLSFTIRMRNRRRTRLRMSHVASLTCPPSPSSRFVLMMHAKCVYHLCMFLVLVQLSIFLCLPVCLVSLALEVSFNSSFSTQHVGADAWARTHVRRSWVPMTARIAPSTA